MRTCKLKVVVLYSKIILKTQFNILLLIYRWLESRKYFCGIFFFTRVQEFRGQSSTVWRFFSVRLEYVEVTIFSVTVQPIFADIPNCNFFLFYGAKGFTKKVIRWRESKVCIEVRLFRSSITLLVQFVQPAWYPAWSSRRYWSFVLNYCDEDLWTRSIVGDDRSLMFILLLCKLTDAIHFFVTLMLSICRIWSLMLCSWNSR